MVKKDPGDGEKVGTSTSDDEAVCDVGGATSELVGGAGVGVDPSPVVEEMRENRLFSPDDENPGSKAASAFFVSTSHVKLASGVIRDSKRDCTFGATFDVVVTVATTNVSCPFTSGVVMTFTWSAPRVVEKSTTNAARTVGIDEYVFNAVELILMVYLRTTVGKGVVVGGAGVEVVVGGTAVVGGRVGSSEGGGTKVTVVVELVVVVVVVDVVEVDAGVVVVLVVVVVVVEEGEFVGVVVVDAILEET